MLWSSTLTPVWRLLLNAHWFQALFFENLIYIQIFFAQFHSGYFKQSDALQVNFDYDAALIGHEDLLNVLSDFSQIGFFDATLDHASIFRVIGPFQIRGYDWRADVLGSVYNFFNTRHTKRDIHGRHTGKVKRFQCHLSAGLADRLRTKRSHTSARLYLWLYEFVIATQQKRDYLRFGQSVYFIKN